MSRISDNVNFLRTLVSQFISDSDYQIIANLLITQYQSGDGSLVSLRSFFKKVHLFNAVLIFESTNFDQIPDDIKYILVTASPIGVVCQCTSSMTVLSEPVAIGSRDLADNLIATLTCFKAVADVHQDFFYSPTGKSENCTFVPVANRQEACVAGLMSDITECGD